jgi:hypothetical protein
VLDITTQLGTKRSVRLSKLEARNPKSETNPKPKARMIKTLSQHDGPVLNFGLWSFEFGTLIEEPIIIVTI